MRKGSSNTTTVHGMRLVLPTQLTYNSEMPPSDKDEENSETEAVSKDDSVNEKNLLSTIMHIPCQTIMPDDYPIITERSMRSALKVCNNNEMGGEAYLALVKNNVNIGYKNGLAFFKNVTKKETAFVDLSTSTDVKINSMETSLLSNIFGIFYVNLNEQISAMDEDEAKKVVSNFSIDINVKELIRYIGYTQFIGPKQLEAVLGKLKKFHNTLGVIREDGIDNDFFDAYMLLNIESIKKSDNTMLISVRSPYISMLIWKLHQKQIKGQSTYGAKIQPKKVISFQDKRLASVRDKRALEIVSYVVALVESTGRHGLPHAKASTIICNCPYLLWSLEQVRSTSYKNRILKRSFLNAWKYLGMFTNLVSRHKAVIPSSDEYPTLRTLDMVFEFRKA
ncbi:MAG: hypothetical protein J5965_28730 [Aeriscardovia sp.]|nr:hypothetical protein [Aeriscardovia sp.]